MRENGDANDGKGFENPCHLFETTTFDASVSYPEEKLAGVPIGGLVRVEKPLGPLELDAKGRLDPAAGPLPTNPLLATAKSREVQRATLAAMRGEGDAATRHFLAAAHMELVLATDYENAGNADLAFRGRLSAASCFWRAGRTQEARQLFDSLIQSHPSQAAEVQSVLSELIQEYPAKAG